jgi:protease I
MCFCEISALTRTICMATLLMPLPDSDFDPTESGVPWCMMRDHGHNVVFATPSGGTARADQKMVTGEELGILSPLLKADANGRSASLCSIFR